MGVRSYDTTRPWGFTQLRGSTSFYSGVCIAIPSYNAMMSFYLGVCIAIPMQACTEWTHSDVWSQLATKPECLFKIWDRQSEKKQRNGDRRAICNATRGFDAGHGVIRHRGVSDGSDGAHPLWRSHSARMEMFFADASQSLDEWNNLGTPRSKRTVSALAWCVWLMKTLGKVNKPR